MGLQSVEAGRHRSSVGLNPMQIDTVKIVRSDSPRGFRVIAADQFDPKVHSVYGAKPAPKPAPKKRGRQRKTTVKEAPNANS